MNSRIVGRITVDRTAIDRELDRVQGYCSNDDYPDYVFGTWKSVPLWNGSGSTLDTRLQTFDHPGVPTPLTRDLPAIASIVQRSFRIDRLKWARLFIMEHGVLLPHRDYLELDRRFTRLHIPLRTTPECLHSEQDVVFHMRVGELWFLDANRVHSACSAAGSLRTTLCLDFDEVARLEELFTPDVGAVDRVEPCVVDRMPLSDRERDDLIAMAANMTDATFRDTVATLAMVHFRHRVHAAELFEWISEGALRSGNRALIKRAQELRTLAVGDQGGRAVA
jgi:putative nonproteinogenic amino acid hydroxylase